MWKIVKLCDVCEIQPKKAQVKKKLADTDTVSFMPMEDLGIDEMYPTAKQTKTLAKAYSSYTYFEDNDVLLAKITPCFENGKLGIASNLTNAVGFGSSEYIVLRCGEEVLPQYIYYHLCQPSFRADGKAQMSGAVGHKRVPKDFVENLEIPLPSLAEQQHIVAKLDAAFAEIDRAIEGATHRQSELETLKCAAINCHFQSLQNEKKMGDVFEFVRGPFGGSLKKNMFVAKGFAVYEQQHAIRNQCREFRYFVSQEKFDEMTRFRVSPNAILMSCSGTIGKTTIIPPNFVEGIINQALLMLKPNDEVLPKFATLYMDSQRFSQQLMERVEGAAQKNVASVKVLKEILIPLPSIEEQQQLVSDIEKILSEIEGVKRITELTTDNYLQLKSAVLTQELQPPQSEAA